MQKTLNAFLYWEYRDFGSPAVGDDDIQAFVRAYNYLTQEYVDWFNSINLPVYTEENIVGLLADWVIGGGLYGYPRPVLGSGISYEIGPFNTYDYNPTDPIVAFNEIIPVQDVSYIPVTDDVYKRCLTWHYFKGDGKPFSIRWLKRRIMRFLTCVNGTGFPVDQTYRVSVTFGVGNQVTITLWTFRADYEDAFDFNSQCFNSLAFNECNLTVTQLGPQFDLADTLKRAVAQGVLELPFQFNFRVSLR